MWHNTLVVVSEMAASICLMACIFILRLWFDEKKKAGNLPKEPMLICDIHGIYPAKYTMKMDVPGMATQYELCPFCMEDRVKKKKVN